MTFRDLEIVEHLEEQKEAIDRKLMELSNTEPWASEMVYLMQIPGFGLIFSMVILSAIGDISRFADPKKLVGYAGLGAGVHASGEKYQEKSITKAGRKELRWALVEAAWVAVRSDPYWKAQFIRLKKRVHVCNTSYPPGHFAVVSLLQTGGLYAQRNQGRIEGKAQACST